MAQNAVFQSNKQSPILSTLAQNVEDFSYAIPPGAPLIYKEFREFVPNNTVAGAPAGQEVVFNLNKANFWRDALIETQCTIGATFTAAPGPLGLRMFESIIIRSNNKELFRIPAQYLVARAQDSKAERSIAVHERALCRNQTTEAFFTQATDTTFKVFTPIFCSFFENIRQHLDLNFYEQIQVVCKYNTQAGMGIDQALTAASSTLWCWSYAMDEKNYSLLRSKNQNPSGVPLTMLTYNTFLEYSVMTGATSNTFRFNLNYPCFKTYFYIRTNTAAALAYAKIYQMSLRVGGSYLLENVSPMVGNYEAEASAPFGASHLEATSDTAISRIADNVWCLNWGLLNSRESNSGAVSWAQINAPTLELTHATLGTPANYTMYVVHEYWQLLSLNSDNGLLEVASYA